jgi:hypothetical protein
MPKTSSALGSPNKFRVSRKTKKAAAAPQHRAPKRTPNSVLPNNVVPKRISHATNGG